MRAATYLIPAATGDPEGAECAVFANIGGGVQANVDRWIGQFELPGGGDPNTKAKTGKQTINGLSVTTIDLLGTYTGGGVAMGRHGRRHGTAAHHLYPSVHGGEHGEFAECIQCGRFLIRQLSRANRECVLGTG